MGKPKINAHMADMTLHSGGGTPSVSVSAVLTASGWEGEGAPYVQTLAIEGLTAGQNGMIALAQSAAYEQREAARDALLTVTGQADGALTVSADGRLPSVDIPIIVTLID